MNIFRSGGIVAFILILFIAYSGTFVVDEREKALVMRFGNISRIEEKPGLNFKIPIAETVIPIEDRLVLWVSPDKGVQVIDGRRYLVDAITMVRIVAPRSSGRRSELDCCGRATGSKRGSMRPAPDLWQANLRSALSKDRAVMMREIRDQVRSRSVQHRHRYRRCAYPANRPHGRSSQEYL